MSSGSISDSDLGYASRSDLTSEGLRLGLRSGFDSGFASGTVSDCDLGSNSASDSGVGSGSVSGSGYASRSDLGSASGSDRLRAPTRALTGSDSGLVPGST